MSLNLTEEYRPLSLLFLISTLTFYLLNKQFKITLKENKLPTKKTIKDIPTIKSFQFWTPPIIEGLAVLYRIYKGGIRTIFEIWASTNYSPLMSFSAPNFQKIIFVSEPKLIKKCLSSSNSILLDKPKFFYDKLITKIIQDGLLGAKFNVWKSHRKILNKLFAYGMLPTQLKIVDKCAQQFIKELDAINSSKITGKQLFSMIYSTTLKIILEMAMGPEIVAELGIQEFNEKFKTLKRLTPYRLLNPFYLIDFIWKMSSKGKVQQECLSYFENYFDNGIEKVMRSVEDELILDSAVKHMLMNGMEKKEIRDEMATLIVAGHETTDVAFQFLMQHLGEHLDIQRRCQEEIDAVFNSKSSADVTMDDLANLKYLEQCILETLRLTPIAPVFGREVKGDIELDDVLIEKGTILVFCPWIIHRHPDYYPDAEKFDPDRFTQEKMKARHPYSFIPFSSGPRNCIGWKLAMMQLKTVISLLLRHYNIYTKDKLTDVKLAFEITLLPKRKFDIWLEKREEPRKEII